MQCQQTRPGAFVLAGVEPWEHRSKDAPATFGMQCQQTRPGAFVPAGVEPWEHRSRDATATFRGRRQQARPGASLAGRIGEGKTGAGMLRLRSGGNDSRQGLAFLLLARPREPNTGAGMLRLRSGGDASKQGLAFCARETAGAEHRSRDAPATFRGQCQQTRPMGLDTGAGMLRLRSGGGASKRRPAASPLARRHAIRAMGCSFWQGGS
jgi:hypothetical protein